MIGFADPIALLLMLPLSALALGIWVKRFVVLSSGRALLALVVRLALISTVVLALAGPTVSLPQSRQAVVFVADLSGSTVGSRGAVQSMIDRALSHRPADSLAGVVAVGRDALVERRVAALSRFPGFQSRPDPDFTNLEAGLQLAGALFPAGYRRRIVLLSDGRQNIGNALSQTGSLRTQRVRLDVVALRPPMAVDVRVESVDVPSHLHPQERFSLGISLVASAATTARLTVDRDGERVLQRRERLRAGRNRITLPEGPVRPGFHTWRVRADAPGDAVPQNNSGWAFAQVRGAPRVLVIAADGVEAANVMGSLRATGIDADLLPPDRVTPAARFLQRYAGVVLVDTPAYRLAPALMAELVPYVRVLGHGLVVIGGDQSFSVGGYAQTPLEQVLPVTMDVSRQREPSSVAVALLIESLETEQNIDVSKEAGKGIVDLLNRQDLVAVDDTPDDGSSGWVVPLQHVTDKSRITRRIDRMEPGDPADYSDYLSAAYKKLKGARAQVKHIILLGDGDAVLDDSIMSLVRRIHRGGVTVSTVATDDEFGLSDFPSMRKMARVGGGRYYRVHDPRRIPKIFFHEMGTVGRVGLVEEKFYPQERSPNPMLRDLRKVPPLYGYVATKVKPAGEVVLASNKNDPVLAAWQYGLGRVVAWTSDASGLWTQDWLRSPGARRFWVNLVSWTLPATTPAGLFPLAGAASGQGTISLDLPPSLGSHPRATARIVDPRLHVSTVQLQPDGPSRYRAAFAAGRQGVYLISVEARGAGRSESGQVGLVAPYPAEYRLTGPDMAFLRSLAQRGGGALISRPDEVWNDNLPGISSPRSLTDLLWFLALLLLPLDVAVRRLSLGPYLVDLRKLASS